MERVQSELTAILVFYNMLMAEIDRFADLTAVHKLTMVLLGSIKITCNCRTGR